MEGSLRSLNPVAAGVDGPATVEARGRAGERKTSAQPRPGRESFSVAAQSGHVPDEEVGAAMFHWWELIEHADAAPARLDVRRGTREARSVTGSRCI